ncbi:5-(carboxyamino)imidazole ribonucleotide synthase [soil metagenome]
MKLGGPLPPGSTIGILGGGQLGRMLALAAARLGLKCHIYAPKGDNPAFQVAAAHTEAAYDDEDALARFAASVGGVTYEFENVPEKTAALLAPLVPLAPSARVLATAQDRLAEKEFLSGLDLTVAPYAAVEDEASLEAALARLGRPAILKTRRFGYDGKGQVKITPAMTTGEAWAGIGKAPSVLEGFVAFESEISVIAARGWDGQIAVYDIPENRHANHILKMSTVPARLSPGTVAAAQDIAQRILAALDYVGVIGIELFVVGAEEKLIVNEIAPRVHNSGHWTMDACAVSQFEQHIRAVAGWPLGSPARHSDAVMTNLIGEEAAAWRDLAAEPGAAIHLYGKAGARPGRKMGHVNRLSPRQV